jgi:ketosteroid isomerase-like protein
MQLGPDEREIHEMHSSWIDAVNAGDLVRLLTLMVDDVVFLNPGQAPVDSRFGSVAAASWQRSWSSAKLPTRGAGTRCR